MYRNYQVLSNLHGLNIDAEDRLRQQDYKIDQEMIDNATLVLHIIVLHFCPSLGQGSWNYDEVYSRQHYVITFTSELWQVGGFLRFPPSIQLNARI